MAKVVEFAEQNATFRGDGKTIGDMPCYTDEVMTISCWELSEEDLANIVKTGKIFVAQMNYNEPLQPQAIWFENPFFPVENQEAGGEA